MPLSKIKPEDTFTAFHTRELFTSVARRFGVARETLRRWWICEFGEDAYIQRTTRLKPTLEERKALRKAYRERNRERLKAQKRAYNQAHPEKVQAWHRADWEKHKDKRKAHYKGYYVANAERLCEAARQYRVENKEEMRNRDLLKYRRDPKRSLLNGARQRAKRFGRPFEITELDVVIPERCPITKEPFEYGEGRPSPRSMSLDRINPKLGYIPGNIAVISHQANALKRDCTDPEVFRRIADYLERKL